MLSRSHRRRWSARRGIVLLALVPLLALAACHQGFGTGVHGAPATGPGQGTLTNIRTAAQPGFDRIVFDFRGPAVYGVGVSARHGFRIFTLTAPNRVVVDVQR